MIEAARSNAREVRTALTREVWEATNGTWLKVRDVLARPVAQRELPEVLGLIRQESAIVRGALHGTMLRNDIYDFARLGTFLERADNTARILDVKYHVLLPSAAYVGSTLDNVQWETILRSVSAQRGVPVAERRTRPAGHRRVPDPRPSACPARSRSATARSTTTSATSPPTTASTTTATSCPTTCGCRLTGRTIDTIFEDGLHEFLGDCIGATNRLATSIEFDYRFTA